MKTYSLTEIELRAIDKYGDVLDVLGHYQTLREAREDIPKIEGETVAWVIERHTSYGYGSGTPDRYTTLDCGGDADALEAGGWSNEEVAS